MSKNKNPFTETWGAFEQDRETLNRAFGRKGEPDEETEQTGDRTTIILSQSQTQVERPSYIQPPRVIYKPPQRQLTEREIRENKRYSNGRWSDFFINLKKLFLTKYILIPIILSLILAYMAEQGSGKYPIYEYFVCWMFLTCGFLTLVCWGLACFSSSNRVWGK